LTTSLPARQLVFRSFNGGESLGVDEPVQNLF